MAPAAGGKERVTVFDLENDALAGLEEASVYVYFLPDDREAAAPPAWGGLSPGAILGPRGGRGATGYRPNLTITRQRTGQSLDAFVAAQHQALLASPEGYTLQRKGAFTLGKLPAQQAEFRVTVPGEDAIMQWQVAIVRGGYAYGFFMSTTPERWAKDKERAAKILAGFRFPGAS